MVVLVARDEAVIDVGLEAAAQLSSREAYKTAARPLAKQCLALKQALGASEAGRARALLELADARDAAEAARRAAEAVAMEADELRGHARRAERRGGREAAKAAALKAAKAEAMCAAFEDELEVARSEAAGAFAAAAEREDAAAAATAGLSAALKLAEGRLAAARARGARRLQGRVRRRCAATALHFWADATRSVRRIEWACQLAERHCQTRATMRCLTAWFMISSETRALSRLIDRHVLRRLRRLLAAWRAAALEEATERRTATRASELLASPIAAETLAVLQAAMNERHATSMARRLARRRARALLRAWAQHASRRRRLGLLLLRRGLSRALRVTSLAFRAWRLSLEASRAFAVRLAEVDEALGVARNTGIAAAERTEQALRDVEASRDAALLASAGALGRLHRRRAMRETLRAWNAICLRKRAAMVRVELLQAERAIAAARAMLRAWLSHARACATRARAVEVHRCRALARRVWRLVGQWRALAVAARLQRRMGEQAVRALQRRRARGALRTWRAVIVVEQRVARWSARQLLSTGRRALKVWRELVDIAKVGRHTAAQIADERRVERGKGARLRYARDAAVTAACAMLAGQRNRRIRAQCFAAIARAVRRRRRIASTVALAVVRRELGLASASFGEWRLLARAGEARAAQAATVDAACELLAGHRARRMRREAFARWRRSCERHYRSAAVAETLFIRRMVKFARHALRGWREVRRRAAARIAQEVLAEDMRAARALRLAGLCLDIWRERTAARVAIWDHIERQDARRQFRLLCDTLHEWHRYAAANVLASKCSAVASDATRARDAAVELACRSIARLQGRRLLASVLAAWRLGARDVRADARAARAAAAALECLNRRRMRSATYRALTSWWQLTNDATSRMAAAIRAVETAARRRRYSMMAACFGALVAHAAVRARVAGLLRRAERSLGLRRLAAAFLCWLRALAQRQLVRSSLEAIPEMAPTYTPGHGAVYSRWAVDSMERRSSLRMRAHVEATPRTNPESLDLDEPPSPATGSTPLARRLVLTPEPRLAEHWAGDGVTVTAQIAPPSSSPRFGISRDAPPMSPALHRLALQAAAAPRSHAPTPVVLPSAVPGGDLRHGVFLDCAAVELASAVSAVTEGALAVRALERAFSAWSARARLYTMQLAKAGRVMRRRSSARIFAEWRSVVWFQNKLWLYWRRDSRRQMRNALGMWRAWARRQLTTRHAVMKHQSRFSLRLANRALTAWASIAAMTRKWRLSVGFIRRRWDKHILAKYWRQWTYIASRLAWQRQQLRRLKARWHARLEGGAYDSWKWLSRMMSTQRRIAEATRVRCLRRKATTALLSWRTAARMHSYRRERFEAMVGALTARTKRAALREWLASVRRQVALRGTMQRIKVRRCRQLASRAFSTWRRCLAHQQARMHRLELHSARWNRWRMSQALYALVAARDQAASVRAANEGVTRLLARRNCRLLAHATSAWHAAAVNASRRRLGLQALLRRYGVTAAQHTFSRWVAAVEILKVERAFSLAAARSATRRAWRLLFRVFSSWREAAGWRARSLRALAHVAKRRGRTALKHSMAEWRAAVICSRRWRATEAQAARAAAKFERVLLRRVLTTWRGAIETHKECMRALEDVTKWRERAELADALSAWRAKVHLEYHARGAEAKAARAVAKLERVRMRRVVAAWRSIRASASGKRHVVRTVVSLYRQGLLSSAFIRWLDVVEDARVDQQKARRESMLEVVAGRLASRRDRRHCDLALSGWRGLAAEAVRRRGAFEALLRPFRARADQMAFARWKGAAQLFRAEASLLARAANLRNRSMRSLLRGALREWRLRASYAASRGRALQWLGARSLRVLLRSAFADWRAEASRGESLRRRVGIQRGVVERFVARRERRLCICITAAWRNMTSQAARRWRALERVLRRYACTDVEHAFGRWWRAARALRAAAMRESAVGRFMRRVSDAIVSRNFRAWRHFAVLQAREARGARVLGQALSRLMARRRWSALRGSFRSWAAVAIDSDRKRRLLLLFQSRWGRAHVGPAAESFRKWRRLSRRLAGVRGLLRRHKLARIERQTLVAWERWREWTFEAALRRRALAQLLARRLARSRLAAIVTWRERCTARRAYKRRLLAEWRLGVRVASQRRRALSLLCGRVRRMALDNAFAAWQTAVARRCALKVRILGAWRARVAQKRHRAAMVSAHASRWGHSVRLQVRYYGML